MRRVFFGLAVTALTVLALAGPASAATGQVTQFRLHGTFAETDWFTSSPTSFTATTIFASRSKHGSELFVGQFVGNTDANGNFTGGTNTSADVTSGFSFAIDQTKLTAASTSGSGLPAMACTFDANGNQIGCSPTTIDVTASWTGQGPITRSVINDHFKTAGFSVRDHMNGTSRNAAATGTLGGVTLNPADVQFADLGTTNSGTTTICIGNSC